VREWYGEEYEQLLFDEAYNLVIKKVLILHILIKILVGMKSSKLHSHRSIVLAISWRTSSIYIKLLDKRGKEYPFF